ncbi:MAG: transcription-repair coupling factor [Desulfovermiculus sp.]|nr:transcription-repair coupling factor [Desulfovermiculus sp.]
MLIPPKLQKSLRQANPIVCKSGPASQAIIAQRELNQGRNVLLIVPDQGTLAQIFSIVSLFSPSSPELPIWEQEWLSLPAYDPQHLDRTLWAQRWAVLYALRHQPSPKGLVLSLDNLLPYWPPPSILDRESFLVHKGEDFSPELLVEQAIILGFERVSMVTRIGELSWRGDILDIFPPGYSWPIRLEFFGDLVESMRVFEPLSQRSRHELQEMVLLPCVPAVFQEQAMQEARDYWTHLWTIGGLDKPTKSHLETALEGGEQFIWPGLFYPQSVSLGKWLREGSKYLLLDASQARTRMEGIEGDWNTFVQAEKERKGLHWPEWYLVQPAARARKLWIDRDQILFESLPVGDRDQNLALPERRFASFQDVFWQPEQRKRPWRALVESLKEWLRTTYQVVLVFHTQNSRRRFLELIGEEDIPVHTAYQADRKGVFVLIGSVEGGYELHWNHVRILSEDVLQPGSARSARRGTKRTDDFKGLKKLEEIEPDDLLVHRDYGLGQYAGLTRMQVDQTGNDYLVLIFAGEDKLYVPADRLNLIQKYKGPENATPALDRLGSIRWSKTKERVRKVLEAIAHDLVQMYAYRKVAKGYSYVPDQDMLREFETTFGFEETPDQEQAIRDVFADMESDEPMDRLVCGDAGFGKTEVALRAAFRAVCAGKQVAMLCPTTVLAEQHYQTFKQRMEDFSVQVEMVSRFVPARKQKKILAAAEKGQVDILIGTHRLLSADVHIPNLGLFILDEEQRFGVKHKEKLKNIRQTIDVLTLTATPIPRTLQLSLSGIRGLSIIETPPQERKTVQTSLVERDKGMLGAIVQRELDRQGQVFWVSNRVQGLPRVKEYVQSLAPGARVAMAHGQMSERNLEETMHAFWHGEVDILVSTAIIESGLDFPRANTLIVDQAQMFGLGQLYQLRGRVGRSKVQAYAYFVVPSVSKLPKKSARRLQTILDMDYHGAGFQVAMEDLRLRGAGNILGEVQSGTMSKVGLDLFLEMLEQEVRRVKGEPVQQETDPELNITFEANIPGHFVPAPQERLQYYRGMSSATSDMQLAEWVEDLHDRFGALPEAVHNLVAVLKLKRRLAALQVKRADLFPNRMVVHWSEDSRPLDPETFLAWLQTRQDRTKFDPPAKLELRFEDKASISTAIEEAGLMLDDLLAESVPSGAEH